MSFKLTTTIQQISSEGKYEGCYQSSNEEVETLLLIEHQFERITQDDMNTLAECKNVELFSAPGAGIKSIEANFPDLPNLSTVMLDENELGSDALVSLTTLKNLINLTLDNNKIESLDKFALLKDLENLKQVNLSGNPVAETEGYREKLFELLPQLEVVDNFDRNGEEVEIESSDEDGSDDDSDEDGSDEEGSDEDEDVNLADFYGQDFSSGDDDLEKEGGDEPTSKKAKTVD
jgi:Leucine-rich repeat (LRR) protein